MCSARLPNLSLCFTFACAIAAGMMSDVGLLPCNAQTLIFQEGFNDDQEGSRYSVVGRGSNPDGPDGPGAWDLSTLVERIGLVDTAPAKRAAILWTHDTQLSFPDEFWTDDALQIFTNVVDWAIDGKQNANIYVRPNSFEFDSDSFLVGMLEERGHVLNDLPSSTPIPGGADLVINSSADLVQGSFLADKPVPVVSYYAVNHGDSLISKRGTVEAIDPAEINVVPGNENHPVLGGRTGSIAWTNDPLVPLQGIGEAPLGATVLATYMSPLGVERPAIVLIEEGGPLLGSFNPTPEGAGYWVGGDMNLDFGDGIAATPSSPRVLEMFPVDVSSFEDVKLTVALAATDADFETEDYLKILIDTENTGFFEELAVFRGVDDPASTVHKSFRDTVDGTTLLRPDEFIDVTYDIPSDATQLVVRFEAFGTFPNEIVGIDNLRITSGEVGLPEILLQPGDVNKDGEVGTGDVVQILASNKYERDVDATWGDGDVNGAPDPCCTVENQQDPVGDGRVNTLDIVAILATDLFEAGQYAGVKGRGQGDAKVVVNYDPDSGNVSVKTSEPISSFHVESASGIFTGEAATGLDGPFDVDSDTKIFKATFGDQFSVVDFGQVAQTGLSEAFLVGDLSAIGSFAAGGTIGGNVELNVIPEPSTVMLLALGLVGLVGFARRPGAPASLL